MSVRVTKVCDMDVSDLEEDVTSSDSVEVERDNVDVVVNDGNFVCVRPEVDGRGSDTADVENVVESILLLKETGEEGILGVETLRGWECAVLSIDDVG